jgi:hypothetical protein
VNEHADYDSAKRMADAVNLHVHARLAGGDHERPMFVAIRLADGRSPDGVLYDTRPDVFRHHPHERGIFAVKVGIETMSEKEALIVLNMARMAFKRGVIFSEEEVITPQLPELLRPFIPRTLKGLRHGYPA